LKGTNEGLVSLQAFTLHLNNLKWASTDLLTYRREGEDKTILVIALQLLGLVRAVGRWVIFRWAVVQPIGLASHIVVERMLSQRLPPRRGLDC
jgi:hypothetical protein